MISYKQRLDTLCASRGRLCIGIDPMPSVLEAWEVNHDVAGLERCSRGIVEALGERVAVFKPQSAFFEPFGSAGIAVLERVLEDIRQACALSILDIKRGDIGSSMSGYAQAYLATGSPLAADAITVSPFLGFGSLAPAIDLAAEAGRGIYVLARTSNPEGGDVQQAATASGATVSQMIVDAAQAANVKAHDSVGLVIGGTHDSIGCDVSAFSGSILVPGIGAQGGSIDDLQRLFGAAAGNVLPTTSRAVIGQGPRNIVAAWDSFAH